MSEFYVYTYTNEVTQTVFYVGKGKGTRAWYHPRKCLRSKRKNAFYVELRSMIMAGNNPKIEVFPCFSEEDAFIKEIELIAKYGRKDQGGDGTLTNQTDGGDGLAGRVVSEATRERIRQIRLSAAPRRFSEAGRVNMSVARSKLWANRKLSGEADEIRKKMVATRRAKGSYNFSDEHRKKIGLSGVGRIPHNKGQSTPAEVRLKQSLAAKARWAKVEKIVVPAAPRVPRPKKEKVFVSKEQLSEIRREASLKMWEERRVSGKNMDIGQKTAATRRANGTYQFTQEHIERIKEGLKGNKNRLGGKKYLEQ